MPKTSAGLLMYKITNGTLKFFLVHPGGPFWKDKDAGEWSIPKGEIHDGEDLLHAAIGEMKDETGIDAKEPFVYLETIQQKSGKIVHAWAFEGDWSGLLLGTSYVSLYNEKTKQSLKFLEVDRADFFDMEKAKQKINPAQILFLEKLHKIVN